MTRPRACGALFQNNSVLMVQHVEPTRSYWTLPGGGLEPGESPADAVVREMLEETGIQVRVVRLIIEHTLEDFEPEHIFLVEPCGDDAAQTPIVGADPEEAHMPRERRLLQDVAWRSLDEMRDDKQISAVLKVLGEA